MWLEDSQALTAQHSPTIKVQLRHNQSSTAQLLMFFFALALCSLGGQCILTLQIWIEDLQVLNAAAFAQLHR